MINKIVKQVSVLLILVVVLGLVVPVASANIPPDEVQQSQAPNKRPFIRNNLDPNKPMVALTFDDGPGTHTIPILDVLEQHNAVATFFVTGNRVAGHRKIVERAFNMGNEIANHSWSHKELSRLSESGVRTELVNANKAIEAVIGVSPQNIRPPYGASSERVRRVARENGLSVVMWTVDPHDWRINSSATIYNRVMGAVRDKSIILLHDTSKSTADAAKRIIPALINRGYQLVTVAELNYYKSPDYVPDAEPEPDKPTHPAFKDIPIDFPTYKAIDWAYNSRIFGGINGRFEPDGLLTRGCFALILWRLEGSPMRVWRGAGFPDIDPSIIHYNALRWAQDVGIIGGINGMALPTAPLPRHQMVTMLYRYHSGVKNRDAIINTGILNSYFDHFGLPSANDIRAMEWAVSSGIIGGINNYLLPYEYTNREMGATVLYRYNNRFN